MAVNWKPRHSNLVNPYNAIYDGYRYLLQQWLYKFARTESQKQPPGQRNNMKARIVAVRDEIEQLKDDKVWTDFVDKLWKIIDDEYRQAEQGQDGVVHSNKAWEKALGVLRYHIRSEKELDVKDVLRRMTKAVDRVLQERIISKF